MVLKNLDVGSAMEINFAIKKFNDLPRGLKVLIYQALWEDKESSCYVAAGGALLEPLALPGNKDELTAYANQSLGADFTSYVVMEVDYPAKASMMAKYFSAHLKLGGVDLAIESIDIGATHASL